VSLPLDANLFLNGNAAFSNPFNIMTTRGDIIYRNSSNVSARLALGTNGQVLQSNGTDLI
jgi:hypothetical protein